jgi:hypothetical protein
MVFVKNKRGKRQGFQEDKVRLIEAKGLGLELNNERVWRGWK